MFSNGETSPVVQQSQSVFLLLNLQSQLRVFFTIFVIFFVSTIASSSIFYDTLCFLCLSVHHPFIFTMFFVVSQLHRFPLDCLFSHSFVTIHLFGNFFVFNSSIYLNFLTVASAFFASSSFFIASLCFSSAWDKYSVNFIIVIILIIVITILIILSSTIMFTFSSKARPVP